MHVRFESDAVYGYHTDDFTGIDDCRNDWVKNVILNSNSLFFLTYNSIRFDFSYGMVEYIERKEEKSNNFELEGSER